MNIRKWLFKIIGKRRTPTQPVSASDSAAEQRTPSPRPMSDAECLGMLQGASFGPDAKLVLPSGKILRGVEATDAASPGSGDARLSRRSGIDEDNTKATTSTYLPVDWGVAWFGTAPTAGVCQRCQRGAPVYQGYNGGQPMGVSMCANCTGPSVAETRAWSRRQR